MGYRTEANWSLSCSECEFRGVIRGLDTVCPQCSAPLLVSYEGRRISAEHRNLDGRPWSMWRYREWLPLFNSESPVTLGEGCTPLLRAKVLEEELGLRRVYVKDESQNPTGSFKARGLSVAVTRAVADGAERFVIATAGNAGVALSAYGMRAGAAPKIFAPSSTPRTILQQIRAFGGELEVLDGHIGDCGVAARDYAAECGAFDISTLKEPYRIEGKKTMGLEIAEQLDWELPDVIIYPTGGGTGLIGMWKCFKELRDAGWVGTKLPRMYCVQSQGCPPVIQAFASGASTVEPWDNPQTVAVGLKVPAPIGGRLALRALRESHGGAVAISDDAIPEEQRQAAIRMAIDFGPEGATTLIALREFVTSGEIGSDDSVVLFNTGSGWLYRD